MPQSRRDRDTRNREGRLYGITADEKSSLVPVVVRLPNPPRAIACGEPVKVRLMSLRWV